MNLPSYLTVGVLLVELLQALLTSQAMASPPLVEGPVERVSKLRYYFDHQPQANPAPTRWQAIGLPRGLAMDPATGRITGSLNQIGIHRVTLRASNADGISPPSLLSITVPPLPTHSIGQFTALIPRHQNIGLQRGGILDLTITATGSCTGRLQTHSRTAPFIAVFNPAYDGLVGGTLVTLPDSPLVAGLVLTTANNTLSVGVAQAAPSWAIPVWAGTPIFPDISGKKRQQTIPRSLITAWQFALDDGSSTATAHCAATLRVGPTGACLLSQRLSSALHPTKVFITSGYLLDGGNWMSWAAQRDSLSRTVLNTLQYLPEEDTIQASVDWGFATNTPITPELGYTLQGTAMH